MLWNSNARDVGIFPQSEAKLNSMPLNANVTCFEFQSYDLCDPLSKCMPDGDSEQRHGGRMDTMDILEKPMTI